MLVVKMKDYPTIIIMINLLDFTFRKTFFRPWLYAWPLQTRDEFLSFDLHSFEDGILAVTAKIE